MVSFDVFIFTNVQIQETITIILADDFQIVIHFTSDLYDLILGNYYNYVYHT